jgi:hypothetical protein
MSRLRTARSCLGIFRSGAAVGPFSGSKTALGIWLSGLRTRAHVNTGGSGARCQARASGLNDICEWWEEDGLTVKRRLGNLIACMA